MIARSNQGLQRRTWMLKTSSSTARSHRLGDCGCSDYPRRSSHRCRGEPISRVHQARSTRSAGDTVSGTALVRCGSPEVLGPDERFHSRRPRRFESILVDAAAAEVASVELTLANGKTVQAERGGPSEPNVPPQRLLGGTGHASTASSSDGTRREMLIALQAENVVEEVIARDSEGNVLGGRSPPGTRIRRGIPTALGHHSCSSRSASEAPGPTP